MRYIATYLCDGYSRADALRPDFTWGKQVKSVDLDQEYLDLEVIAAARAGAPTGYWLQRLEAIGREPHVREVFAQPVPLRAPVHRQGTNHG